MFGNKRGRKLGGDGKIGKNCKSVKNVLIFLPQFNWLSYGQKRPKWHFNFNSNIWHSAHSSQSGFACTAKKKLNFVWSLPPCFCGQNMLDRLISTSQKGDICFNSSNISVGKIHANISLFQQNHHTLLFKKLTHQTFINLSCQKRERIV